MITKKQVFLKLLNAFESFLISDLEKDHEISLRRGPLDLSEQQIQEHVSSLAEEYKNSDELEENIGSWVEEYESAGEGDEPQGKIRRDGYEGEPPKNAQPPFPEGEPQIETVERGWPGHFIGAAHCHFRRNTLVRYGDKKVVVSTVGRYIPENSDEVTEIGYDRYFETMAFWADDTKFADANISEHFHLDGRTSIGHAKPYADIMADAMHNKRVEEVKGRLRNGYQAKETDKES